MEVAVGVGGRHDDAIFGSFLGLAVDRFFRGLPKTCGDVIPLGTFGSVRDIRLLGLR